MSVDPVTQCSRCFKKFEDTTRAKSHIKWVKNCVGIFYTCKRCLETFDSLTKITNHQAKTRKPCLPFILDEADRKFKKKARIDINRNQNHLSIMEKVICYLHNLTGDDDPVRTPRIIRLLEVLTNDEFNDVIESIYKERNEVRIQLSTALKVYKKIAKEDRVKEINEFFIKIRKPGLR